MSPQSAPIACAPGTGVGPSPGISSGEVVSLMDGTSAVDAIGLALGVGIQEATRNATARALHGEGEPELGTTSVLLRV